MLLSANIFNGKIKKRAQRLFYANSLLCFGNFCKKVIDSDYSPVNVQIKKYYSS